MTTIKPLPGGDIQALVDLVAKAYPGISLDTDEARERLADRLGSMADDDARHPYGGYRHGRLVGGMILYDFEVNVRGRLVPAGGLGMLAVGLLDKKQKVARDMVAFYLDHYRRQGSPLALLYPFRPDFYKKMGFGYGSKVSVYTIRTAGLPANGDRQHLRFLGVDDMEAVLACANRYARRTHGMVVRAEWELKHYLTSKKINVIGYERDGRLSGYLVFDFDTGESFNKDKLRLIELVCEDRAALLELLAFAQTQADQAEWTILRTFDDYFYFMLADPRHRSGDIIAPIYQESNRQGVGLMYKVMDVTTLMSALEDVQFGPGACRVKVEISDSLTPANQGAVVLNFEDGRVSLVTGDSYDVAIKLDVSEFSSLVMGAISFRSLFFYGLVEVSSDEYVEMLDTLFATHSKPVCLTRF